MLKLYNTAKDMVCYLTNYKNLCIETDLDSADKTLTFTHMTPSDLKNEYYVEDGKDRYVIKELHPGENGTDVVCQLDLEVLEADAMDRFTAENATIQTMTAAALTGTGWTAVIDSGIALKQRSVQAFNIRPRQILEKIRDAFMCELYYDSINMYVYFMEELGEHKGVYMRRGLNLSAINTTIDSYDYYTQILPIGKDNLRISSVNDGSPYLQNFQYSTKIRTYIWEDTSYEDASTLKEDAVKKLNDLSKPKISYDVQVRDLANMSEEYSLMSYTIGDTIELVDSITGIRDTQRIVRMKEYPDEPEKNTCELSNTVLTFEELQERLQKAANAWEEASNSDGSIKGVYVHGVQADDVVYIEVVEGQSVESTAQAAISSAQTTANSKALIFTGSTTPAGAKEGDLWFKSASDPILTYINGEWTEYNKYTDDSSLTDWLTNTYASDKSTLETQIDGKIETWHQSSNPASAWTTAALKTAHTGDLWYCTATSGTYEQNQTYRYDGTAWVKETAPAEVFDAIDGKAQVFTSQPVPPYAVGDLWFNSDTSDIMTCTTARSSGSYTASDWAKRNKYTDDTTANTANERATACRGICATAAGTAAKVVTCNNFVLVQGATVTVCNTTAQTVAETLTLNVNATGAKQVYVGNEVTSASNQLLWTQWSLITFVYDGTYWRVENNPGAWYGTACTTGDSAAAKTTTVEEAVIFKGTTLIVAMNSENTNTAATLNVSSLGAKNIYYGTTTTCPTTANNYGWMAGMSVTFTFDGAYWRYTDAAAMKNSNDAKKTATNYMTDVTNDGVFVHESSNSDVLPTTSGANGVHITDDVDIIRNGEVVASYGEAAVIGKEDESRAYVDYHSFQMIYGDEAAPYVHLSDLRGQDGLAEVEEWFSWYSSSASLTYTAAHNVDSVVSVTLNDNVISESASTYTRNGNTFTFYDVMSAVRVYTITYKTTDPIRVFTMGSRISGFTCGDLSFTAGYRNIALGYASQAFGHICLALAQGSHAEGWLTNAQGGYSHAEGRDTIAKGTAACARNLSTKAYGDNSQASGYETTADGRSQTVIGEYNYRDRENDDDPSERGKYVFIIGNGSSDARRSNALAVDWDGNLELTGGLTVADGDVHPVYHFTGTSVSDVVTVTHNLSISGTYYPLVQACSASNALFVYGVKNCTANSFEVLIGCMDGYVPQTSNGKSVTIAWTY